MIRGCLIILMLLATPAPFAGADADRANALVREVTTLIGTTRSAARDARIEKTVAALDALPDDCCLDQKVTAHIAVNRAYRKAGVPTRLGKHTLWLIDAAAKLAPELRARHGDYLYTLHVEAAEAWSGRGEVEKVRDLIARLRVQFRDAVARPSDAKMLDRFGLLERPAPPITATKWLNLPSPLTELPLTGGVTLVEFSAHWCAPCEWSYPALKRLQAKYGSQGLRVVIGTGLYGYYKKEKNLAPEVEIERDRVHFAKAGLTGPIAISAEPNSNSAKYFVEGIPQIHVIDARGVIRLMMHGWDGSTSEASLDAVIGRLLKSR